MPTAGAGQEVRFVQGVPTTFSDGSSSSVQVTPLGYIQDDNRFAFGVAAFNKGQAAFDFSLDDVHITSNGIELKTYTRDALAREARNKAIWAGVAMALAGAAAAYAANQNAYRTTSGYVATPRGVATFSATTYDPALAYAGTAAASAATTYGIVSIKNSLDSTITRLNGSILQVNTIDPGASAGGQIVVDMPKAKNWPQPLEVSIGIKGAQHRFAFSMTKKD